MIEREPGMRGGIDARDGGIDGGIDAIETNGHRLANPHAADFAHRHRRFEFELGQIDDIEQFAVYGHMLARLDIARRDLAAERRAHDGVRDRQIR